jgi:hypothetical protein
VKCLRPASKTRRRILSTGVCEEPRNMIDVRYCPQQEPHHKRRGRPPHWHLTTFTSCSRMGKHPHSSSYRRCGSCNNNRKCFYGHDVVPPNRPMDETPLQPSQIHGKKREHAHCHVSSKWHGSCSSAGGYHANKPCTSSREYRILISGQKSKIFGWQFYLNLSCSLAFSHGDDR